MRIRDWSSDVCSSDLPGLRHVNGNHAIGGQLDPRLGDHIVGIAERPVHRVDRLHALADAGLEITDIGVEAQTVDRLEHSGQFGTPELGIAVLVHGCTIANLRYLIVGIIIEEGNGVEFQKDDHQQLLHSEPEGIKKYSVKIGPKINKNQ